MAPLALSARPSLGPTLERLAGRGIQYLDLAVGGGPAAESGWIAPSALLEPALLEDRLAQVAVEAEFDDPRLLGTYLIEGYVHALATPALGQVGAASRTSARARWRCGSARARSWRASRTWPRGSA